MRTLIECTPPNSVVVVCGGDDIVREWPDWSEAKFLVAATADAILVGTYPSSDGPTTLVLTDENGLIDGAMIAWEGVLPTPLGELKVSTCEGGVLGVIVGRETWTFLRIWLNDERWPDRIVVQCLAEVPPSG